MRQTCPRFLYIATAVIVNSQLLTTKFAVVSLRENFHLLDCALAGRTTKNPPLGGFIASFSTQARLLQTWIPKQCSAQNYISSIYACISNALLRVHQGKAEAFSRDPR